MAKHVVLVDRDAATRHLVEDCLASNSLEVSAVADNAAMERVLSHRPADLIILDLEFQDEDGLDLMREINSRTHAPIILLNGDDVGEAERVIGLELGADDYITKPFGMREFLARVRAVLRRTDPARVAAKRRSERPTYRFGDRMLATKTRRLCMQDGVEVPLTAGEYSLLLAFMRAPQQVLSREHLINASRMHDEEVFDRTIDVLVLRLRRKIEVNPARPLLITTERCAGYMLTVPVAIV